MNELVLEETTDLRDIVAPAPEGTIVAYHVPNEPKLPIVPAPHSRRWMETLPEQFAYRCLPMMLANQSGWFILNEHPLGITWNGSNALDALSLYWFDKPGTARSHFGYGIVTWTTSYLFRTPPGINLQIRGPANWPKDGMYPLEGIVETDWSTASFTINWKITRPQTPLLFERGEPIFQIVPVRRGELEEYTPVMKSLEDEPALHESFKTWLASRNRHLKDPNREDSWQKHYFKGLAVDGHEAPEHQMKLKLRGFHDAS